MAITGTGSDTVNGNGGSDDILTGLPSTGASTMTDSGANDTFNVTNTGDVITGDSTSLISSTVTWTLSGTHSVGVDDLTLTGTSTITGTGNAAGDVLTSSTTGTDKLIGAATAGNDTFILNHTGDTVSENGVGTGGNLVESAITFSLASVGGATTTSAASVDHLILTGTAALTGTGNSAADTLTGNANTTGNTALISGSGTDTLIGHSTHGTDTFTVSNALDAVTETSTATTALVDSSASFDLATGSQTAGTTGVNQLTLTGSAAITGTGNADNDTLTSSSSGIDALIGDGAADTFYLNHASDTATENNTSGAAVVNAALSYTLTAYMADLTLTGTSALTGQGNTATDVLTSNTGIDKLIGFSALGNDTFNISNSSDVVSEVTASGGPGDISLVNTTVTFSLNTAAGANIESLTLTGSGHGLTLTGNTSADLLTDSTTGTGSNKLIGNSIAGGDTFVLAEAGDTVTELGAGTTNNLVESSISYALTGTAGAHLDNLTLEGTANLSGTGNVLANKIIGNTGNDVLNDGGTGGNDTLIGHSTTGADTFSVNNAGDSVTETTADGSSVHLALVNSTVSFSLGGAGSSIGANQLTLTGASTAIGTGNTDNDLLTSSTVGVDTLIGYSTAGNDTFYVNAAGDSVTETTASSSDTNSALVNSAVSFSLGGAGASIGVNELTMTNAGTTTFTGTGNTSADVLTSTSIATAKDVLIGHDASSTPGDGDTFVVNNISDTVSEAGASSAVDLVDSSVTWTLGTGMKDLTLTGSSAITGTGNTLGDVLTSSTTGTDKLVGAATAGNDTFILNHTGDTVSENGVGTGGNLVESAITFSLASVGGATTTSAASVDHLILTNTTGTLTATGNAAADTLTGGTTTGSDVLISGAGLDTLIGNSTVGADTFAVTNAGDSITEANGGAHTTGLIQSSYSFNLTSGLTGTVNELTLTNIGTTAVTGTGNTNTDILTSSGGTTPGVNVLIGNSALGNDTFTVNNASDTVTETTASGGIGDIALVNSSVTWTLNNANGAHIEALTLLGTGSLTGTGNTSSDILTSSTTGTDVLIGNGAADTFILNHAGDTATENDTSGAAVVDSVIGLTLGAHMVDLTLTNTGTTAITGTGNASSDVLTGSMTGKDVLVGDGAADTFNLNFAGDTATENDTSGAAVVNSAISFSLGAHMVDLTLTGTGNHLTAEGNAVANAHNILTDATTLGGAGTNTLIGKSLTNSDDTFVVNHTTDVVSETSAGTNTALIDSSVSWSLATGTTNVNDLTLTATGITGTGNSTGGDIITGNSAGNDLLSVGADTGSADTLIGEATSGSDTFTINNTGDIVSEAGSSAGDAVNSSVTWALGATHFDALTLTGGSHGLVATGNGLADVLFDNTTGSGGNTLIGNDTTATTHDTFYVNNTSDLVSEHGSVTGDLIYSDVNFTLGAGFEQLNLTIPGVATDAATTGTGNAAGGDTIIGNHNNDVLSDNGGTAADTMTGNSTVIGSTGGDTFTVSNASDVVSEAGSSTAALINSSANFSLVGTNVSQLTLTAAGKSATGTAAGGDTLIGSSAGNDTLSDGGNSTGGGDVMTGFSSASGDTFIVHNAADVVTETTSPGTSILESYVNNTLGSGLHELILEGTVATSGTGNALANVIIGNTNTDFLNDGGIGGSDTMTGNSSSFNDTFYVNNSGDHVTETTGGGAALISSTTGFDLHANSANVSELTLTGTGTGLTLAGNALNDTLTDISTGGANVLTDNGSTNGLGHDLMTGGNTTAGTGLNDTFIVSYVGDTVSELDASSTTAAVQSAINYTLGANLNILTLTGSATQGTAGTAGGDTINGDHHNNILSDNGGAADTMVGNSTVLGGGDTFMVNIAGDTVSEAGVSTAALIDSSLSYSLGTTGVHQLTLTGSGSFSGTGSSTGGDTIIGNSGDDTLSDGGTGNVATLEGNSGDGGDKFIVHNAGDTISEANNIGGAAVGTTIESYIGGNSAFNSLTGAYADFYNIELEGSVNATATGNNLSNIITGNTGDDLLISGTGVATMTGNSNDTTGAGNDTFEVNNASDAVTEAGTDTGALIISSVSFDLATGAHGGGPTGVHQLTLTGNTGLTGTGNTAGGDTIISTGTGNDTLSDGGNDTGAADKFEGSSTSGGDTFMVNVSADSVTEAGSEAGAFISSSVSFDLTTNSTGVHQLTLTGTGNESGVGTAAGGDTITGGSGNDVLSDGGNDSGGAGDALIGNSTGGGSGTGADTFILSNSADTITETNGVSTSTLIESSASYTLGAGFDGLTLIGTGTHLTATGNASNDTITDITTTGGNVLTDGNAGGNDTMIGGNSTATGINDTFVVSYSGDHVTELGTSTTSLVQSSINFNLGTDSTGINNLTLEGTSNLSGTGSSAGGNSISGNTGNDTLSDGSTSPTAADTLIGDSLGGHDTFIVHNASDSITESGTAGANLVEAYGTFSLASVTGVGRLTLEGTTGGLTATGNSAGSDTITDATSVGGNTLNSGSGTDVVLAGTSSGAGDTFIVNDASDTVTANHSASTIEFGTGVALTNYTIVANVNNLSVSGSGNENITGNSVADTITLTSNSGTDIVTAGSGLITAYAGTGADTFILNSASDLVTGNNTGTALVDANFKSGSFLLGTNVNDLNITSTGTGHDTITGNSGNDSINAGVSKSNELDDGTTGGTDTLYGGGGFDVFVIHNSNDIVHEAAAGNYLLESYASFNLNNATNISNLTLEGTANISGTGTTTGQSVIVGNQGADILSDGNNTTGLGDSLYGTDSNTAVGEGDTFIVNNSLDTVEEDGATTHSTVEASVNFTLGTGIANLILTGTSGLTGTGNVNASNVNTIVGNSGADTLSDGGTFITNTITGNNADTMIGHSATGDLFTVFNAGDKVIEDGVASSGSTVESYTSFNLATGSPSGTSTFVNNLTLEGNGTGMTATANTAAGTITDSTSTGGNILVSGSGIDALVDANTSVGPTGDTFVIHNAGDTVTEVAGAEGVVQSYVSFSLASVVTGTANSLTLEGTTNATATGATAGGDTLTASNALDVILNDNSAGAADTLVGGTGHDTFDVTNSGDTLTMNPGGVNTISTNLATFTLVTHENALIMTAASATGTALASETAGVSITGQGGSDILVGGSDHTAADTLIGSGGTDTFTIYNSGDHVTESSSAGTTVLNADITGSFNWTLGANIHTLNAYDGGLDTGSDNLTANNGGDSIIGSTGTDIITSGTGTDTLVGNSTSGTDTFYINHTGDSVTEANTGTTAVISSDVTFSLATVAVGSISHLILTGNGDANGTGNGLGSDTIDASTSYGNDALDTGTGTDNVLYASLGNDTLTVRDTSDVVHGNSAGGNDLVNSAVSFTLGSYIDDLTLTAQFVTGAGNGASDLITGSSAANNVFYDGGGASTMIGNAAFGNGDEFHVTNANDVLSETNAGGGHIGSIVDSTVSWTLGTGFDELQLTGTGGDSATGNNGADGLAVVINDMAASTGGDVLSDGGASTSHSATLTDNSTDGGDTFIVSNTNDTVAENTSATGALIESSVSWSLLTNTTGVNDLTLTGSNSTATANGAGGNILTDNTGDGTNTLDASSGGGGDTLIGGNDVMKLGTGSQHDTVEFNANTGYNGIANIENFNVSNDTLNIDNIITNSGNASISYKLVADGSNTDLLVDYNVLNHSYGYTQVAIFTGAGVTYADLNGHIIVG